MDYRYTAAFTAVAKIVDPTEADRFVAKASLQPLRGILPADLDLDANPDLLYIASNGAVAALANKNNDLVDVETALACYKTAKAKYISTDHDRTKACGTILYPALTRFGSNEVITEEEARALNEPFNMAVGGVLWKTINSQVARYIYKDGGSTENGVLSLSWEIMFNEHHIAVGSRNLFDAKIVKADDPSFTDLSKRLRANGGKGKDENGQDIYRIITGPAVILGYSIVENPAAAVKGILPVTEVAKIEIVPAHVEERVVEEVVATPVVVAEKVQPVVAEISAAENISKNSVESCVTSGATPSMKIQSVDQIQTAWPELQKLEAKAAVEAIMEAIHNGSAEWEQKIAAEKSVAQTLAQAKSEAEARATDLEKSLNALKQEVTQMKAAQAAAEQNQKFQERMALFDEQYTLDDEDRGFIATEIKDLSDEAFAAYQKRSAKLMSGKKKGAPPFEKKEKEVKEEKESCASVKEAVASVTETVGQVVVPPGETPTEKNLLAEMDEAFGESIKIGGKTLKTRRAEKLANQPKE